MTIKKVPITLEDIASQAGVSSAAVSQALSGKGTLSQATRERILQVVEELAYRPNEMAQNLALRRSSRAAERQLSRSKNKLVPPQGLMVFYPINELAEVVHLELQQMEEEGYETSQCRETLASIKRPTKKQLHKLYETLLSAPMRADYRYHEPVTLVDIQAARPPGPRKISISISSLKLYEHIHGAWLGRIAGSVLGKPVQAGWSKKKVVRYLQLVKSDPLGNYIPRMIPPPVDFIINHGANGCFLGEIHGAPDDDDTNYSILALHILETHGVEFQTADVATQWLEHIPYFHTYTTERAVYRNLIWNIHPDEAAFFVNPEREYIGARTRADLYGYVAPGMPEFAAAMAYKDAALSHTKNGVYSAMFMAAMLSWTYLTSDAQELILTGLSEIPEKCRLAEAVQLTLDLYRQGIDWEVAYEQILLKYGSLSPIHSINNTLWVVLSLLYARGDFNTALGMAVTCGMDTGSNAASTGSLAGLAATSPHIPGHWTAPLEDHLSSAIAQFSDMSITDLARRTAAIAEKNLSSIR
jgi:ADP-ribosylglycohydrolase/transcriptional regulator with XRE-family HTH domain